MAKGDGSILTNEQLADYEELGFLHSIPILSADEVRNYRAEVEPHRLRLTRRRIS